MPLSISLEGKVALVSGASRGIGRAIALKISECGASVVVNYLNSSDSADEVVAEIIRSGGKAIAIKADVSDYKQAQDLVKFSIDTFGKLDILVNNAGITRDKLIMLMTEDDWDVVQSTNLKSTFNCSKAAVKHMMRNRYGRIINITSVAGQMGNAGQTNYSASKAGQIGFTKALAREVADPNITVNGNEA
jgi:3-oxoacyl-[acyl-carrier protein] reductase